MKSTNTTNPGLWRNREQIRPLEGHKRRHNKTTVDTTSTPTATLTTKSTCIANASKIVSPSDTMQWTRLRRSVAADLYVICDIYEQAITILPIYFAEPVKHWFYQLSDNSKTSIMSFNSALFTRQGDGEDIDSYIFRYISSIRPYHPWGRPHQKGD